MADAMTKLIRTVADARPWLDLLGQDRYWVPRDGYGSFAEMYTEYTTVDIPAEAGVWPHRRQEGVRLPRYPTLSSKLEALDASAGERMEVAEMGYRHRLDTVAFLWRKAPGLAQGAYWAGALAGGPDVEYDDVRHAMDQEIWRLLPTLDDESARVRWFNEFPLIIKMRGLNVAESEARTSRWRPVLLG